MKLVIIIGAPAVGKMTIGQELEKLTDLKLFHNHMSLELVNKFFDFGTESLNRLDKIIRFAIFKEVANSELKGLIFTIVWDYNSKEDEEYIDEIIQIFSKRNSQICLVELNAELEERLKRNRHENRLKHKPSKRNLKMSEKSLKYSESEYRMSSYKDEFEDKKIYKIDNSNLTPEQVAEMLREKFKL